VDERQAENIPFEPDADNADAGMKEATSIDLLIKYLNQYDYEKN